MGISPSIILANWVPSGYPGVPGLTGATSALPNGTDSGSVNAYVVNPSPAVTATYGQSFTFTTSHACTGAATMNASGSGVIPFRTLLRLGFTGGEIVAGTTYQATFDGTYWLLAGSLAAGAAASPAGNVNLSGAYVVGTPTTGNAASTAGLTFLSSPSDSGTYNRNLLNFVLVPSSGDENSYASFGFDGDDVFIVSGNMAGGIAFIPAVEHFQNVQIYTQSTGDAFTLQQNNTPLAASAAIVVVQPIGGSGTRLWEVNASTGKVLSYNGIPTVSGGQPAEYATLDLVSQGAAIGTTTLYTPVATGMFRISVYAKVTTIDAAGSSLGGSTGLVIGYTDGSDSVAQTLTAQLSTQAGTPASVNAGNTTATKLVGAVPIFAKTGVPITYAFGYGSSGSPPAMGYELHLKLEAL